MIKGPQFERLVIAAYRLPFKVIKTKKGYRGVQNSGGLVSAILSLSENFIHKAGAEEHSRILWTGIADNIPEGEDVRNLGNEHFDLAPVNISPELNDLFYGGFCNDLIWPLFHYFPTYCVFDKAYYQAYVEANLRFRDEILKVIRPGDFIWIHDYQLMLLPEMIREKVPDATIGFFLHIPFPSFEIFRLLPRHWRESIIQGMLGADLIGFHTHDYSQHFIKSVRRTTGYECHLNTIYTPNKLLKADAFPIGIDYERFSQAPQSEPVLQMKEKIRATLSNQKLIFSVDRLDYSKGLLLRLKGYETFLEKCPKWHTRVVFNMVVVPSRDRIEKYRKMKNEIESTVGRINGKYSSLAWQPIIYQYRSLSFHELVALYDLSDIGLITPLRDGMNLVAKEYVASQVENEGVLILSEMAGAAAELNEALIINPVDSGEMSKAIFKALEMSPEEKHIRLERMKTRIANYHVGTWAFDFFNQTNETKRHQHQMKVRFINEAVTSRIIGDYRKSKQRILFLDYDGTLVSFARFPELARAEKETLDIIRKLTEDPANRVVIISGRDKDFLENQFKGIEVTLVAEHGYFIKRGQGEWLESFATVANWKDSVMPILMEYVSRCNGTFIEEKAGSLAWHYRNADLDYAQLRLNELRDDLAEIIRHKTDFEILEGNKVLEVKSGRYDKGEAASSLLRQETYDFILAAGDDKTDEFLFQALPPSAYSIRIGLSPSFARYNLSDYSLLIDLLKSLTRLG
ncbi:MAG: bifunctional alpha,alpha-trehalose-phosphate synthase (UDP-forming)/trehalose-phosphatase [Bacteroidales bacterium]